MIFSPENQYAIVCVGVSKRFVSIVFSLSLIDDVRFLLLFSKSSSNSYKFASINFETEKMENYHDGSIFDEFLFF